MGALIAQLRAADSRLRFGNWALLLIGVGRFAPPLTTDCQPSSVFCRHCLAAAYKLSPTRAAPAFLPRTLPYWVVLPVLGLYAAPREWL